MFRLKKRNPFELVNIITLSTVCYCYLCITLTDVTKQVFQNNVNCVIAAFGDFNSDKYTDVFCLKNNGKTLEILISYNPKDIRHNTKVMCKVGEKETITGIMPADYNGDSMLDVLITVGTETDPKIDVRILWGSLDKLNCISTTNFSTRSQPLIMDFNGDMIPDIFTERVDERVQRYFYSVKKTSLVSKELSQLPYIQELSYPHSSAFIDLNCDQEPDLFISGKKSMEYWFRNQDDKSISFNFSEEIPYPPDYELRGQSSFVDINGDSIVEHIIPVCKKSKCAIMIRSLNSTNWNILFNDFNSGNETWCFKHSIKLFGPTELPITLQNADFDMDGMPDILTIISNEAGSKSRAILLKNVPCSYCPFGRKLVPLWDHLSSVKDVVVAAFFDIFEDGVIDILLTTKIVTGTEIGYKLQAFQNMFSKDAYFIKVLVLGGLCYDSCPGGQQAYGVNQPGPCITYKTTGPDGTIRTGKMVQLSQSAHFALQLPYSIFGLGQTPNFLDELQVVTPGGFKNELRLRTWTQIIPNSQIVVIPFPSDSPKFWVAKLFVTPSHSILLTFAALVGTCLFICLIIGALHWKERRADRRERLLEAHRFHFDAM